LWTYSNPAAPIEPVPLSDTLPVLGQEAWHAGYPPRLGLWLSWGLIGSEDEDGAFWSSVPLFHGSSGGPIIVDGLASGIAMGILTSGDRPRIPLTSISCIVPIASVRDWIDASLAADPSVR
jgi:hypothetical protein